MQQREVLTNANVLQRSRGSHTATDATNQYLMQAAKMGEIKEKEGCQENPPALTFDM